MSGSVPLPGYRWFRAFRNAPVRLGVYIGVCLSVVFTGWLLVANRAPLLERFALERNVAAAALIVLVAVIPILRFLRSPRSLLLSGLISWIIFSFIYRILCLFFSALDDWHTTLEVLMIGIVLYLIAATLSWLVTVIRRVRHGDVPHFRNHIS
ncbi:MAG TPA: hypothetical protein VLX32_08665 [Candidatus Acidoferrum sp.]|nr:hypothetical protein [Candidatus Acidoferrum sp.]